MNEVSSVSESRTRVPASGISAPIMGCVLAVSAALSGCVARQDQSQSPVADASAPAAAKPHNAVAPAGSAEEAVVTCGIKNLRATPAVGPDGKVKVTIKWDSVDSFMATVGYSVCEGSLDWIQYNRDTKTFGPQEVEWIVREDVAKHFAGKTIAIQLISYQKVQGGRMVQVPVTLPAAIAPAATAPAAK